MEKSFYTLTGQREKKIREEKTNKTITIANHHNTNIVGTKKKTQKEAVNSEMVYGVCWL